MLECASQKGLCVSKARLVLTVCMFAQAAQSVDGAHCLGSLRCEQSTGPGEHNSDHSPAVSA